MCRLSELWQPLGMRPFCTNRGRGSQEAKPILGPSTGAHSSWRTVLCSGGQVAALGLHLRVRDVLSTSPDDQDLFRR